MSSSVFGSNFSYEEVEQLYGLYKDLESRRVEDSEIAGRAVFVVESKPPADANSAYERVLTYIEQERCVPLQVAFIEKGDEPRKVVRFDPEQFRKVEDAWVALSVEIEDRSDDSRTRVSIDEVKVDVDISKSIFSQSRLGRGR